MSDRDNFIKVYEDRFIAHWTGGIGGKPEDYPVLRKMAKAHGATLWDMLVLAKATGVV